MRGGMRTAGRAALAGAGLAAIGYGAYVAATWRRYGHPAPPRRGDADEMLDRYMPVFDVVERHHVEIAAPPDVTFAAARDMRLMSLPIVRAVFSARTLLLGADGDETERPEGLVDQMLSIGWGVLEEAPGREIVAGAVTKPWEANVTFRALPPAEFAAFSEPGFVKIAWTLRADPAGSGRSVFRTETRAVATDAYARSKFRLYWSFLSPGILLIRRLSLQPLRREAERIARESQSGFVAT